MEKFVIKIIVCAKSQAFFKREDVGAWEIREIEVTETQYDARDEEGITRPYYTDDVVYVGVYSWME